MPPSGSKISSGLSVQHPCRTALDGGEEIATQADAVKLQVPAQREQLAVRDVVMAKNGPVAVALRVNPDLMASAITLNGAQPQPAEDCFNPLAGKNSNGILGHDRHLRLGSITQAKRCYEVMPTTVGKISGQGARGHRCEL